MTTDAKALAAAIVAVASAGVLARPWRTPAAAWAAGGAVLLAGLGLAPLPLAFDQLRASLDVCLFLTGMMLLSETARREGLFDVLASIAVSRCGGSRTRLFALVYGAGVVVTVFLSNDATAVVLTPAVYAAARKAEADPLPHLFSCAMVANAASFVAPISNPANLVLFASHPPPLAAWAARFAAPSAVSIVATFLALWQVERGGLKGGCRSEAELRHLTRGGWAALAGLGLTLVALIGCSAADVQLGVPTAVLGLATAASTLAIGRGSPWKLVRGVSWSILPLVAGLFVMVGALERIGLIGWLAAALGAGARTLATPTGWLAGAGVAVCSNLVNNLPAGLAASAAAQAARAPEKIRDALLIGVDLGPNLSVTGSLATLLWLAALKREGVHVSAWRFLRTGAIVMPPALALALAARLLV